MIITRGAGTAWLLAAMLVLAAACTCCAGQAKLDRDVRSLLSQYKTLLRKSAPRFEKCDRCGGDGVMKVPVRRRADGTRTSGKARCTACFGFGWQFVDAGPKQQELAKARLHALGKQAAALEAKKADKLTDADRLALQAIKVTSEEVLAGAAAVRIVGAHDDAVATWSTWCGHQLDTLERILPQMDPVWTELKAQARASDPKRFTYRIRSYYYRGFGEFADGGKEWRARTQRSVKLYDEVIEYGEWCRRVLTAFGREQDDFCKRVARDLTTIRDERSRIYRDRGRKTDPRYSLD